LLGTSIFFGKSTRYRTSSKSCPSEGPSSRYGACAAMQRRRSAQRRATGGGVVARALSRREARAIAAARRLSQDVDVSRGAPFGRCRSVSVPRIHAPRLIALRPQTPRFWEKKLSSLLYRPVLSPSRSTSFTTHFPGKKRKLKKKKRIRRQADNRKGEKKNEKFNREARVFSVPAFLTLRGGKKRVQRCKKLAGKRAVRTPPLESALKYAYA